MIHIVTGPPCAGKSTYIDQHRAPEDVVLDLDRLAHSLGYPTQQIDVEGPSHQARDAALIARASLLKRIDPRSSIDWWIVATYGLDVRRHHADVIALDPGAAECHRRADADHRPSGTHRQIDRWYADQGGSREW